MQTAVANVSSGMGSVSTQKTTTTDLVGFCGLGGSLVGRFFRVRKREIAFWPTGPGASDWKSVVVYEQECCVQ